MSKLPIQDVSTPVPIHSVLSSSVAQRRVINYMGHAVDMLDALHKQNLETGVSETKTAAVYQKAFDNIKALNERLLDSVSRISPERDEKIKKIHSEIEKLKGDPSPKAQQKVEDLTKQLHDLGTNLSKKEITNLKENLHKAEKEIATILHRTQIDMVAEIGEELVSGTKDKVATLAKGGWGATVIRFLSLVSKSHRMAVETFELAKSSMQAASRIAIPAVSNEREVDQDKRAEFERFLSGKGKLDRRAGVIGLENIYRIQVTFDRKEVKKQFRSFTAQNISNKERTTLNRPMILKQGAFTSRLVPLNTEFDKQLGLSGTLTEVFTNIFGTKGITSVNREEPHLVNGWETNLIQDGQRLFRSLRHAIASDKHEKDPTIRENNSKKAAEELLKAALLQEIGDQGLTLEQASAKGIQLNFNSVSLVTPDDLRPYLPGQADEKQMLTDQVLALRKFEGKQEIELDGVKIPVVINTNTFNFGVNALAVTLGWGLSNQYEHNKKAFSGFRDQFTKFHNQVTKEIMNIGLKALRTEASYAQDLATMQQLTLVLESGRQLMHDIEHLMGDEEAYLKGDNQYEIGAKILNLSNLMDQTIASVNLRRTPQRKIAGFKSAFNCMSGKDRTGIMDAMAKAFAMLAANNEGVVPTHEEFTQYPSLRRLFAELLTTVLLEGGGLEITGINTEAQGYKVKDEARIFGMTLDKFLQVQGLSATTSS